MEAWRQELRTNALYHSAYGAVYRGSAVESWRQELRFNELYHTGQKGQKWGLRRYQNPDGSLTPLGRIHYGVGEARTKRPKVTSEQLKADKQRRRSEKEFADRASGKMKAKEKGMYGDVTLETLRRDASDRRSDKAAQEEYLRSVDERARRYEEEKERKRQEEEVRKKAEADALHRVAEEERAKEEVRRAEKEERREQRRSDREDRRIEREEERAKKEFEREEEKAKKKWEDDVDKKIKKEEDEARKRYENDMKREKNRPKTNDEIQEENTRLELLKKNRELKKSESDDERAAKRQAEQDRLEEVKRVRDSYTEAGKGFKEAGVGFSTAGKYMNTATNSQRQFLSNQTWTRKSQKELKKMSNEEFNSLLSRMEMERKYSSLTANDALAGRQAAEMALYNIGAVSSAMSGIANTAAALYSLKERVNGSSGGKKD